MQGMINNQNILLDVYRNEINDLKSENQALRVTMTNFVQADNKINVDEPFTLVKNNLKKN